MTYLQGSCLPCDNLPGHLPGHTLGHRTVPHNSRQVEYTGFFKSLSSYMRVQGRRRVDAR
jgi:hypothetical protein